MSVCAARTRTILFAGAMLIAPAFLFAVPAQAQGTAPATAPATTAPPSAAGKPPVQSVPQAITAEVTGFRSARFGMTDEQVREAIKRDFDVDAKDVKKLRNEVQKTDILEAQVENLVPGSGTSKVFYIFGYSSKKLIHVNVVWGRLAQQTVAPASLVNTGTILQNYFKNLGLQVLPGVSNKAQLTLFQGIDEKKRAIQLVLEVAQVNPDKPADPKAPAKPPAKSDAPAAADGKPKPAPVQLVASSLKLSYVENLTNPDVYSIPKGKF